MVIQESESVMIDSNVPHPVRAVELTRGMTFYLERFNENFFGGSHTHCINDLASISETGPQQDGYVTFKDFVTPNGGKARQYWWVCRACFEKLRESMGWTVGSQMPAGPPTARKWARRHPPRSQSDREKLVSDFPFAIVGWAAEEIVAIARGRDIELSLAEASELLLDNERQIEGAMTEAGRETILELLGRRSRTDEP